MLYRVPILPGLPWKFQPQDEINTIINSRIVETKKNGAIEKKVA